MNYWKILPILFAAALITAACSAPQTKKSEPTSSEVAYEGPEYVETYETADGNPKQASHIVINKATLTLKLYDKRSRLISSFPVAVGRIHGQKRTNGDLKSPEGEFKIGKIQAASNWKSTSADGKERVKGGYGPWFIRLDVPNIASVGICGTLNPELVGLRSSTGNIVMRNSDLDSLTKMINQNVTVTINPGERDLRADGKYTEDIAAKEQPQSTATTEATAPEKSTKQEAPKVENTATTDSNGDVWHTIAKGEYISTIAAKYGTTTNKIKRLNPGLNVDRIREGQRIKVYGAEEAATTTKNAKAESTTAPGEVWHTVAKGELASKIVSRYGITLSELKRLNPGLNVDRIREGQKLRVK